MKKLTIVLLGILLLLPFSVMAAEPFNKDLRYGMAKNAEVKRMQEFLRDEGLYKGQISGNFLSMSLAALKSYQKREGLKVTGRFDSQTRKKVNELLAIREQDNFSIASVDSGSAPIGWIANGDGTFSPPSVYQPTVSQPQTSVAYDSQPTIYNPPVATNNNQTVTTQPTQPTNPSSENRAVNPPPPSSMPTSTPTTTPTMIVLNSTIFNQSRHYSYPSYFPFYYYVNCSPTSTDNRFNINVFDSSLDFNSIITSNNTGADIGFFTLNDQKIYDNDSNAWMRPDFFDLLMKSPKIKSLTVKNNGTVDLRNINFAIEYDVPSAKKDSIRKVVFTRGERTKILPTSVTKDTATFNFASPLPTNLNGMMTEFYLLADLDKIKKLETIDFQITGVDLENNDPTRNYSLKTPVTSESGKVLKKCDVKS